MNIPNQMLYKTFRLLSFLLLFCLVVVGCNRVYDEEIKTTRSRVRGFVTFDTRAQSGESINRDNADYEDKVNKIRLIACLKSTGEVLHNAVHPLSDFANFKTEIPLITGEYDFFFVANETQAMTTALDAVTFRDALFQKAALARVPVSNVVMERIDPNVGIPMTAHITGTVTANHKKGSSLQISVKLIRTLAKMTINIQRALQTAGNQKGQPTEDAAPVTVSAMEFLNLASDYSLFVPEDFRTTQTAPVQKFTTNISPVGNAKITRTFYLPEFVSLNAAPAYVQFTFSKHGEEKKSGFVPLIGNQQLFSESGYSDKFIGGGSPGSIVRNLHYVANVEVKGWEENVVLFNWNILPWNKEASQKDYAPAQVETVGNANNPVAGQPGVSIPNGHRNWINLDPSYTNFVTLRFKVKSPQGGHWRFTLTNHLDFEFADNNATYGLTSDNQIVITVRAKKPWTGVLRSTELYLTVDGKEVPILGGGIGPNRRILIRQTS